MSNDGEKQPPAEISDSETDDESSLEGYYSDAPLDLQPNYPPLRESFDTVIIMTNLPKVPPTKVEKLTKIISKLVGRIGNLASCPATGYTGFHMPVDPTTGTTDGFAFVEYETPEEARNAVEVLADYKFDKSHILAVYPYERAMALRDTDETNYTSPEPQPFSEKANTTAWLMDSVQRDQFVIREGKETIVMWSDGKHDPSVDYDGEREKAAGVSWCEYYVHWSPKGSFLATLVPSKGVILWAGSDFEKVGRFPAAGVQFVSFSPQEKYLLTNNNNPEDDNAIKVFSIESGKLLRSFPLFPENFTPPKADPDSPPFPPPPFQWSHDDKYLARMGPDLITIYETPSMKILDRRSLSAEGIHEFQWSPKANILAYWAPEVNNSPAHVDLIEIPSRKKLRQKNLFNVTKCGIVWQDCGDYLGVKVTRHTKSKKTLYNNLELFRMNEPGIPVEMLDIKDAVMAFAWEPRGDRFAMIHAENPTSTKVKVSFYDMKKKVEVSANNKKKKKASEPSVINEVNLVETLENKQCNCIFWSPAGNVILMAGLGDSASGTLEFYDIEDKTLAIKEHYRANSVLWDPSGRTLVTTVSQPIQGGHFKFAMDNGYILWSFQGKQLHQASYENFYQLQWRPREVLLSKNQVKDVRTNLKKYEKTFDKADRERSRSLYLEETKGKRTLRSKFRNRLARLRGFYHQQKPARVELLGGYDSEDEANYVEKDVQLETIMSETSKTISN